MYKYTNIFASLDDSDRPDSDKVRGSNKCVAHGNDREGKVGVLIGPASLPCRLDLARSQS